jgi:mycofactocin precursor
MAAAGTVWKHISSNHGCCGRATGGGDAGGRPFMSGENADTEVVTEPEDADEAEELLVEEISIDGMCGVY